VWTNVQVWSVLVRLAENSTVGKRREMISFQKKTTIFAQGDPTDGLFFMQKGKVLLNVVSERGREPTPGI